MSDVLEILIVQHFQAWKFCFLLEKSFISETGRSQGHVPKGLHEHLFTSAVMVIPISCLLLHQCLQLWRLQKTQKRTLLTLNQQMEVFKWNTTLISCSVCETKLKWPEILCPIPEAMSHTAACIIWVCSFLIIVQEWHFSFFHSLQSFIQYVYVYVRVCVCVCVCAHTHTHTHTQ